MGACNFFFSALVIFLFLSVYLPEASAQSGIEGKRGPGGRGGRGGAAAAVAPKDQGDPEFSPDSPHNIAVTSKAQLDELMTMEVAFLKFYAPWCGHCKSMAADWNKLADAYGSDSNIVIASVDVTQNQDIGKALDIKGFPTLKLFSKGNTFEYKGKRSYQQLKSFVDGGYIRQGKVKTEEEMNIFDHAYKRYQEFMLRVLRVVQTDFLLPMVMLLVGFVVQKLVANYFPPKADPAAVDKTKRLMRKRKQMMAEEAERQRKAIAEEENKKFDRHKLVKDERKLDLSQIGDDDNVNNDDDDDEDDVDH